MTTEIRNLLRTLHPLSSPSGLVRMGSKDDGGYLVPNDLIGIEACFSPGVGYNSGFEKDCAGLNMQVFLADKSVDGPAEIHELFSFTKKFLGPNSNEDFITLDDWVTSSVQSSTSDLLLQIDIEGGEYEVFSTASKAVMQRFRIIVAEFHSLDQIWNDEFYNLADSAFSKILQTHSCVHIHPNNFCSVTQQNDLDIPSVMEFTFLRNDRINNFDFQVNYPHRLDRDNASDNPTLKLPKCWYRSDILKPVRKQNYLMQQDGVNFVVQNTQTKEKISLNDSAALIWHLAGGTRTEIEIMEYLKSEVEVGAATIRRDVTNCINELTRLRVL